MQLAGTTAAGGSNSKPRISLRFFDLTQLHKDTKKGTPKNHSLMILLQIIYTCYEHDVNM